MVLHTWEQRLQPHVHLQALGPGGALADDGHRWHPTHATYLFSVKALSTVFRAKYLAGLSRPSAEQARRLTDATVTWEGPRTFDTFVKQLRRQKWIVYAQPPFGGPEQTWRSLGRSTHRVAIANHRLLDRQGDQRPFTCRNRQQGDRVEVAQLEAHPFLKRFLCHVLPTSFMRMRHDGLLANRGKAHTLPLCRQARGHAAPLPPSEPQSVAQWMQRWTGLDITRCPTCGHQPPERLPLPVALGPTGTGTHRHRAPQESLTMSASTPLTAQAAAS